MKWAEHVACLRKSEMFTGFGGEILRKEITLKT
jgi:hypothetical protein